MTGISGGEGNRHIIRSEDGQAAVWVGVVDDLWNLGKAVGHGGPWKDSAAKANVASDPYLMTGSIVFRTNLAGRRKMPAACRRESHVCCYARPGAMSKMPAACRRESHVRCDVGSSVGGPLPI